MIPRPARVRCRPAQSASRAAIVRGDVLGMAGPGKEIAAILPCTVIAPGDMAAELLDREKNPEWTGRRTKLVYRFPSAEGLWEEYGRLRGEGLRAERGPAEATAFYAANRAAMDEGAEVAWPERKGPRELSGIQHAMNLRLDLKPHAFFAEYQNDPLPLEEARPDDLTADQVAGKLNRHKRGLVPRSAGRLTAFVDVQANLLYYVVAAWEDDFTGSVVDYGTYPDQRRAYFALADARITLAHAVKAAGLEGRIYGGLEALAGVILSREWPRDDGATLRVERCLVDANWGTSTAVVRQFCRQSAHAAVLTPSHGKYIGAGGFPMNEWPKHEGERVGHNWRLRRTQDGRGVRSVVYDTNYWKSFLLARLGTAMGDRGCLSLFGDSAETHRMFADHLTAEYRVKTEGRGRTVDEWKNRPERPENHWWDCLVGCGRRGLDAGRGIGRGGAPAGGGGEGADADVGPATAPAGLGRWRRRGEPVAQPADLGLRRQAPSCVASKVNRPPPPGPAAASRGRRRSVGPRAR